MSTPSSPLQPMRSSWDSSYAWPGGAEPSEVSRGIAAAGTARIHTPAVHGTPCVADCEPGGLLIELAWALRGFVFASARVAADSWNRLANRRPIR